MECTADAYRFQPFIWPETWLYVLDHPGKLWYRRCTMLKMRLQRTGRKNDASFRVVVTDSRRGPKSGKHVDLLGSYNPKLNQVQIDGEKAKEWIAKGVQVSDTMHNLLVGQKIIEGKKVNVLPRKSPIKSADDSADSGEQSPEETVEANPSETAEAEVEATEGSKDPAPSTESEEEKVEDSEVDKKSEEGAVEEKEEKSEEGKEDAPAEENATEESAEEKKD